MLLRLLWRSGVNIWFVTPLYVNAECKWLFSITSATWKTNEKNIIIVFSFAGQLLARDQKNCAPRQAMHAQFFAPVKHNTWRACHVIHCDFFNRQKLHFVIFCWQKKLRVAAGRPQSALMFTFLYDFSLTYNYEYVSIPCKNGWSTY